MAVPFIFGCRRALPAGTFEISMLGTAKPALRNSLRGGEFTAHSRRGPEGPQVFQSPQNYLSFRLLAVEGRACIGAALI